MRLRVRCFAASVLYAALFPTFLSAAGPADQTGLWQQLVVEKNLHTYTTSVLLPAGYDSSDYSAPNTDRLPVIVFLHGAGERGANVKLARSVGLPIVVPERPHILVVPQTPQGGWWSDTAIMDMVMSTLEQILLKWGGDRNRIYLTGLSMGGHGALQLAARFPDQFAAVVAICPRLGRPSYLKPVRGLPTTARVLAQRLQYLPVWLFHGDRDDVVPVQNSRNLAQALDDLDADSRYTEIPGGDHGIWPRVYSRRDVMDWLFSKGRRQENGDPKK